MQNDSKLNIKNIFDVILAFRNETRYDNLVNIILCKMMEITNSDGGTLYIKKGEKLHYAIIKNISMDIFYTSEEEIRLPPILLDKNGINNVSAYSAIHKEIVIADDVYSSENFNLSGPKEFDALTGYKTTSMLVLPLYTFLKGEPDVLGVIQLVNAIDSETGEVRVYDKNLLPIIPALANIAANTLANLIHITQISELFHSFVGVMAQAIDERSSYNSNHTRNVAMLCDKFARYISRGKPEGHKYHFNEKRLEDLSIAATLHDIGKIITPLSIMDKRDRLGERFPLLRARCEIKKYQIMIAHCKGAIADSEYKTLCQELAEDVHFAETAAISHVLTDTQLKRINTLGRWKYANHLGENVPIFEADDIYALGVPKGTLTPEERKIMEDHVVITGRLLDNVAFSRYYEHVPMIAKSHHEFLDGTGYPKGLKGDEIPTEARMMTIVDIFEALTATDRPYKKNIPAEIALEILSGMANAGKLDTELLGLFRESKVWIDYEL